MNIAFLGLGGNLGNRLLGLERAIRELEKEAGIILQRSGVFETAPWGKDSTHQYLNMVLRLGTSLTPSNLLTVCQKIEKKLGRRRGLDQYEDRTMDIDILYYDDLCINSKSLQIPHPRLHLRKFVLGPLAQIAPDFKDPIRHKKIKGLLKHCPDTSSITFISFLKPKLICVEGNIGSGKTTLCRQLAKDLRYHFVEEAFEKDNLVRHFYQQPDMAMSVEFNFLLQRYFQFEKIQSQSKASLCDFSFYRSLWFAAVNLKKTEFKAFASQFRKLNDQLIQPDLVILLNSEIGQLSKNIGKRGRKMEKDIGADYLSKLQKSYRQNVLLPGIPLVTIDITSYSSMTTSRLTRHVQNVLKENFAT